jgi:hypothetical protein
VDPGLTIARHRRGTSPKLSTSEQDAAVERVVHTDELTVRDRAAAILVIVFGQHIEDVIQLTWADVTVTDDVVTVRLGRTEFALPSPLDEPMRGLAAAPGNDFTASHPNSYWVFRGYSPGRHIHGSSLRSRCDHGWARRWCGPNTSATKYSTISGCSSSGREALV